MATVIESVLIPVYLDTKELAAGLARAEKIINERIVPIVMNARAALKEALDFGSVLNEADLKAVQAEAGKIGAAVKAGLEEKLRDLAIGLVPGGGKPGFNPWGEASNIAEKGVTSGPRGAAGATVGAMMRSMAGPSEALRIDKVSKSLNMSMRDYQAC